MSKKKTKLNLNNNCNKNSKYLVNHNKIYDI